MFKYLFAMIIPVCIFIYTLSFMRWAGRKSGAVASVSAGALAVISLAVSGATLWRILT
ncbi:hypothetical protein [Alicyclobacillus fructus]|uniref:hypothetical protein n=1 Tax=Alicyclobacillus fructus TaxID=2816082 RepID=UPI001A903FFD|nr:hypothetical protein [Alicyclobacillus fructus]